jgi:hypothetical protein
MRRTLLYRSVPPVAGRPPIAAKPVDIAAISRLERRIADAILTLTQSDQWTEATRLREQVQLLAQRDVTVRCSLTNEEIATVLSVETAQVKRQLRELNIVRDDDTVADEQPEFLSNMGRLAQENERLKGEIVSLKTKVQRLKKLRDDTQPRSGVQLQR